jgi:hypothetical protein
MKIHKLLYLKNKFEGHVLFHFGRKRDRGTDFIDRLIHASTAKHYDHDRSGNFLTAVQSKGCYMKNQQLNLD